MLPKLGTVKHIHLVGIGGAGMNGIAEVLVTQGYRVSGSDMVMNAATQHLQKLGVKILCGHHSDNINGADIVVYSSAVPKDNPELIAAEQAHVLILARAQMLAELMESQYGIAVAGTHGKTTTTGLITAVLTEGGLDPTFVIGGTLMSIGVHARLGTSQYFVAEADESDASFLYLQPKIAVVTNVDVDHLNNYEDFAHLKQTFVEFIHRLPAEGLAVLCSDDPVIQELLELGQISRPILTYGFKETDLVRAVSYCQQGTRCEIEVTRQNQPDLNITLNLPGRHNVLNALAAIAVASRCGVDDTAMVRALAKFQGTGRRFQIYGELPVGKGQALLIDDYGHHPREIAATIEAIRKAWPDRRLVVAFQPHRYTRTQFIFDDFVKVLSQPDVLLLLEIYSAGEPSIPGVNGQILCEAIRKYGRIDPIFVEKVPELLQILQTVLKPGDILLTQGAGDIGKIAPELAKSGLRIED